MCDHFPIIPILLSTNQIREVTLQMFANIANNVASELKDICVIAAVCLISYEVMLLTKTFGISDHIKGWTSTPTVVRLFLLDEYEPDTSMSKEKFPK